MGTADEFSKKYLGFNPRPIPKNAQIRDLSEVTAPPDAHDWVEEGAVTPVKDQAACASSWAFSTIGSVESAYFIKNAELITLSEQQLLSCTAKYGNDGCDGGVIDNAFIYLEEDADGKGSIPDETYPYKAEGGEGCYHFSDAEAFVEKHEFIQVEEASNDRRRRLLQEVGVEVGGVEVGGEEVGGEEEGGEEEGGEEEGGEEEGGEEEGGEDDDKGKKEGGGGAINGTIVPGL